MTTASLAADSSTICFVNNASADSTKEIDHSRKLEHWVAWPFCLFTVHPDAVISIDTDQRDNEIKIPQMEKNYIAGAISYMDV